MEGAGCRSAELCRPCDERALNIYPKKRAEREDTASQVRPHDEKSRNHLEQRYCLPSSPVSDVMRHSSSRQPHKLTATGATYKPPESRLTLLDRTELEREHWLIISTHTSAEGKALPDCRRNADFLRTSVTDESAPRVYSRRHDHRTLLPPCSRLNKLEHMQAATATELLLS